MQGTVNSEPEIVGRNENYLKFFLSVPRLSGQADVIPVLISKAHKDRIVVGNEIALKGSIRTFDIKQGDRTKLIVTVYARELIPVNESDKRNLVELEAFICKSPVFRLTPMKSEICDLILAARRNETVNDYVPSIAWGRLAKTLSHQKVGSVVHVMGRLQSRQYNKQLGDTIEVRTAYELSIFAIVRDDDKDKQR